MIMVSWQEIPDSSTNSKGISSFNNSFSVSSGAVSLKSQGVTGNEIKDATIGGTKLMTSIKSINCGGFIDFRRYNKYTYF